MNDIIALTSLQKGDREAFNTLFIKYAPKLYFFVQKYFNGQIEAEEVVQYVFLKIWETRERIDSSKSFNTYIIAIAKHIIFDYLRHEAIKRKFDNYMVRSSKHASDLEDEIAEKNMKEYLWECIEALPFQQKNILLLKSRGYDNDEIAKRLQLSKRTVETHINRAIKYLRSQVRNC